MTITSVPPIPKSSIQLFLGISHPPHEHFISDSDLDVLLEKSGSSLSDFKDPTSGLVSDKISKILGNIATDISARGDYVTKKIADFLSLNPDLVSFERIEIKSDPLNKNDKDLSDILSVTSLKEITGNEVVYASMDDNISDNLQFPTEWLCEPFEDKIKKIFGHLNKEIRKARATKKKPLFRTK